MNTNSKIHVLREMLGDSMKLVADDQSCGRLTDIIPTNLDDLLVSHVEGPSHGGADVIATTHGGERYAGRLVPTMLLARPVDRRGLTRFAVIGLRVSQADEDLVPVTDFLASQSLPTLLVRHSGGGRFAVWFILGRPVLPEVVQPWLERLTEDLSRVSTVSQCRMIPLVGPEALCMLPYSWHLATVEDRGYFASLENGRLRDLDPQDVPRVFLQVEHMEADLGPLATDYLPLLHEWHHILGEQPVRAGALVKSLPEELLKHFGSGHSRAIRLGTALKRLCGRRLGSFAISSRPAGHSTAFIVQKLA